MSEEINLRWYEKRPENESEDPDAFFAKDVMSMFCLKGSYYDKYFCSCYPSKEKFYSLEKVKKKSIIINHSSGWWDNNGDHIYWKKINEKCAFSTKIIKYALRIFGEKARFKFPEKVNPLYIDTKTSKYCFYMIPIIIDPRLEKKWLNGCFIGTNCFKKMTGFSCPNKGD